MRGIPALALLLAASCGGSQVQIDTRIKRDFLVTLQTERGELTAFIDGTEHLHVGSGRGATLAAQMREGEHVFVFRVRPLEYEGMSLTADVTVGGARAFRIVCDAPCTADALGGVAQAADTDRLLLSQRCADVEVQQVAAVSSRDPEGKELHEVTVKLLVQPPQSPAKRAARGCRS